MLKTGLIHPEILGGLAAAGHGSQVLISDANYPSLTAPYSGARRVYLNLRPGTVTVTEILATLAPLLPIERIAVMDPDDGSQPPVQKELLALIDPQTEVAHFARHDFYAATRTPDLALVIVSGDTRWWANILLTIGATPETASGPTRPSAGPTHKEQ